MNVAKKLEFFSRMVIKEARDKRDEILTELNSTLRKNAEETKHRVNQEAAVKIFREQSVAEDMYNRRVSEASSAAKSEVIALRKQLTDRLFSQVERKLAEYITTEEYLRSLKEALVRLEKNYGAAKVYLTGRDVSRCKNFSQSLTLLESEEDFIGGFIAYVNNDTVLLDNSFLRRVNDRRQEANFLM